MEKATSSRPEKKRKTDPKDPEIPPILAITATDQPMDTDEPDKEASERQITKVYKTKKTKDTPEDIPIRIERARSSVPPKITSRLLSADIIGHLRPPTERFIDTRFYQVNPTMLLAKIKMILNCVLPSCYHNKSKAIAASATSDIAQMVPLTADACMSALYAKLRTIHKQYGKYSSRFTTPASYHKDIELPTPLADAISNIGVFESTCATKCYLFVPVFPEGTKYEGRSQEEWNSNKYESCMEIYRRLDIPLRNVDTRVKTGSAWWTLKIGAEYEQYFATMIVPPLHYSDNAVTTSLMFMSVDNEDKAENFVQFKTDDENYGKRFRRIRSGAQTRAFMALAQMTEEDWTAVSTST